MPTYVALFLSLTNKYLQPYHGEKPEDESLEHKKTTPYKSMLYEDSRKKAILEHAQLLHGATYPANHTWTVILSLKASYYTAHVSVSEEPGNVASFKTLCSGEIGASAAKALDSLLEGLYGEAARRGVQGKEGRRESDLME